MSGYGPPGGPPQSGGYGPPPSGGGYGPPPSGGYGPPPSGGYGSPPGYGGQRGGVNFATVNPLDWAIIAAGVLALIFSFFSYYSAEFGDRFKTVTGACAQPSGNPDIDKGCNGDTVGAWHGFFGWFGVLLLLVAALLVAIVVFAPQTGRAVQLRLFGLGASAAGLLCTFLALFIDPSNDAKDQVSASLGQLNQQLQARGIAPLSVDDVIDIGRGFSYWIILILSLASVGLSFLRFQQSGGKLPGTGGSKGYSPPAGYGPPPGYGAPQGPPPGYGQPQGPPPGYGQPPAYQQPQPTPAQPQSTPQQPPAAQPPAGPAPSSGEVPMQKPAPPPPSSEQAPTQIVQIPPQHPGQENPPG